MKANELPLTETARASDLAPLLDSWQDAKAREQAANADRLAAESKILEMIPAKAEGTTSLKMPDGRRLTVTFKLNRKVTDPDALRGLLPSLPDGFAEVVRWVEVPEFDLERIRWTEENRPDVMTLLASAVEVKPAKPGISVKAAA